MSNEIETPDFKSMSTEQLLQLEKEYAQKAAMLNSKQMALKICLNSLYGALGNTSFRYFNLSLASSVTTSGQQAIKWIERKLNEFLDAKTGIPKDRVVLIDTDSVVLDLKDIVDKYCPKNINRKQKLDFLNQLGEKVLHPYIEKSYDELGDYMNAYEHRFKMKRENIIDQMVSVAAKSYVMNVYNSEGVQYEMYDPDGNEVNGGIGYLKIMGLQLVKSSTPEVIQDALRESIPILLKGNEKQMQDYIKNVRSKYDEFTAEQIAFPRGVTNISTYLKENVQKMYENEGNPVEKEKLKDKLDFPESQLYIKGTPAHVRGALVYNDLLKKKGLDEVRKPIEDGDKIKFIYLRLPNPIHEKCVAFQETLPVEFNVHDYIDREMMFEKTFLAMIEKMIAPLEWKTKQESYLEDFFAF